QRRVRLGEVVVRAHLHRTVAGVHDRDGDAGTTLVAHDDAVGPGDLPGDHGMGWCSVTSFVPSGNVASTCTSSSISGTPSITSSRLSTWRPASIRSTTDVPSRAASNTHDDSTATA